MVDKICEYLVKKMRIKMPEIDDERAEIINYGLQNIIGELPKFIILFIISYLLGIWQLTIVTFFVILPYRAVSGGFHLHTHLGCIVATTTMYCGTAFLSKYLIFDPIYIKYILVAFVWIFGIAMCHLYAPADTENVPILRKKDRKQKRILSYVVLTVSLIISLIIKEPTISNVIIIGMLIQTCTITKIAYRLTNNQYGYEIYEAQKETTEEPV